METDDDIPGEGDPLEQSAKLSVLEALLLEGRLDESVYGHARSLFITRDDRRLWASRLLLFLGVAVGLAGVICFFAFNWDDLSGLAKLGIVQVGFVGCVVGATLTSIDSTTSRTLLVAAAVLIGVFLAVYGQTYQTGADPWELFVAWSALMTPLVILSRTQAGWAVFFGVATTGAVLLLEQRFAIHDEQYIALAVAALAAAIWAGLESWRTWRAPEWLGSLWSRYLYAVAALGAVALIELEAAPWNNLDDPLFGLPFVAILLATAVLLVVWRWHEFDLGVSVLTGLVWLVFILSHVGYHTFEEFDLDTSEWEFFFA
ncbi:MAG: DUF2157 domain-containing protein, partial [Persicimonas sp.]